VPPTNGCMSCKPCVRGCFYLVRRSIFSAPLNFSKDLKVGPKVKQRKKKKVGAHSLTCSTLKVGGGVGVPKWD
jgi:hypothetical protein